MHRLLIAWLCLATFQTYAYVPVWQSDAVLWPYAAQVAPLKPRPAVNTARALLLQGDVDGARRWLSRTMALSNEPHVPAYDRRDAVAAVSGNLQVLAVIQSVQGS